MKSKRPGYESSRNFVPAQYIKPKRPLMSAEERKRQAQSLVTYRPDGDAS